MKYLHKYNLGLILSSLMLTNGALAATLSLSPSSNSVTVGNSFNVNIVLDTQGVSIDAVDIYRLNYDPQLLEVQDANSVAAGVQITPGILMPNTVANIVDVTNGKISFSQAIEDALTYTGSGVLATVNLKALTAGTANVTFDFTPNSTVDSNVASNGVDILSAVASGQYTISNVSGGGGGGGGGGQAATPTPTPTATPTPTPTSTPIVSNRPRPSQYNLKEGDTVAAYGSDDPDVYIVNDAGFKRLFLNPVIFSFYGHLGGFQNVKTIAFSTRDVFETSGLFRNCETNDPKVYGVEVTGEDEGILHWVDTTGEQAVKDDPEFFNRIFCINNNEFNWYTQDNKVFGTNYTSVLQIPKYKRAGH